MRGLLIKDFYNIWKQGLWYAAMIAMFCGISVIAENPAFSATIGILASASVPLTAIAYEEKDGWQKFAAAGGLSAGTGRRRKIPARHTVCAPGRGRLLHRVCRRGRRDSGGGICGAPLHAAVCPGRRPSPDIPIRHRKGPDLYDRSRRGLHARIYRSDAARRQSRNLATDFIACLSCATVVILAVSYKISVAIYRKKEF